jgi:hypothetical protein
MNYEDYILLEIHAALSALENAFPLEHMENVGEFLKSIEPLTDAVKREDWGLIAAAANMHHEERLTTIPGKPGYPNLRVTTVSKLGLEIQIRMVLRSIYRNPQAFGLPQRPSKGAILRVFEAKYPALYEKIPLSPSGRTRWWKKVGVCAEQDRGNAPRI